MLEDSTHDKQRGGENKRSFGLRMAGFVDSQIIAPHDSFLQSEAAGGLGADAKEKAQRDSTKYQVFREEAVGLANKLGFVDSDNQRKRKELESIRQNPEEATPVLATMAAFSIDTDGMFSQSAEEARSMFKELGGKIYEGQKNDLLHLFVDLMTQCGTLDVKSLKEACDNFQVASRAGNKAPEGALSWLESARKELVSSLEKDGKGRGVDVMTLSGLHLKEREKVIALIYQLELLEDKFKERIRLAQEEGRKGEIEKQKKDGSARDQEKIDVVRERMLIRELVEKSPGVLHTSLTHDVSQGKTNGFQDSASSDFVARDSHDMNSFRFGRFRNVLDSGEKAVLISTLSYDETKGTIDMQKYGKLLGVSDTPLYRVAGVSESFMIQPAKEAKFRKEVVEVAEDGLKGVLGMKKKITREIPDGRRGVRMSEFQPNVRSGTKDDEEAVLVSYKFNGTSFDDYKAVYKDYSGRTGNMLELSCFVPKSLAARLEEEIMGKPPQDAKRLIRQFIEEWILSKTQIKKDDWESGKERNSGAPVRPPFEVYDEAKTGLMFYATDKIENFDVGKSSWPRAKILK